MDPNNEKELPDMSLLLLFRLFVENNRFTTYTSLGGGCSNDVCDRELFPCPMAFTLKFPYHYFAFIFPSSSYVTLSHVPQTEHWDCGVACICMILLWINQHSTPTPSLHDLKLHHHWNKPLWTIEIFYFLKSCGVEVTFFTKFLGVGQHHSDINWYSEHLDEDTERIENLLAATRENNWSVVQVSSVLTSSFLICG